MNNNRTKNKFTEEDINKIIHAEQNEEHISTDEEIRKFYEDVGPELAALFRKEDECKRAAVILAAIRNGAKIQITQEKMKELEELAKQLPEISLQIEKLLN